MKTKRSRLAAIIVALAAAVGLAGCSAIKLGYGNFPDVAYWWLDGYVDFSDEQAPLARAELERLHAWHRRHELPHFIDLLARLERMAPGSVTAQQACAVVAEVQARIKPVVDQAEPALAVLASSLAPEQLRHLERKYGSNNRKFRKQWIHSSLAEQREKRYEQVLDRTEMFYGRLDAAQRRVLRQAIEHSIYVPQRILDERLRRQQDLLQTLARIIEQEAAPSDARAQLRAWLERAQKSPDPAYRAWSQELMQENCRTFAALHASTTAAQREQAVKRLQAYQQDLRELAGRR